MPRRIIVPAAPVRPSQPPPAAEVTPEPPAEPAWVVGRQGPALAIWARALAASLKRPALRPEWSL